MRVFTCPSSGTRAKIINFDRGRWVMRKVIRLRSIISELRALTMRVCSSCGFDSAPYNEPCTLCGAMEEPETVVDFGDSDAPTALKPTHAVPRPSRRLARYDPGFVYA